MHDELCRKCGGMLTNWSLCSECRKPVKRICLQCGVYTEERIHNICFYPMDSLHGESFSAIDPPGSLEKNMYGKKIEEPEQLLSEVA